MNEHNTGVRGGAGWLRRAMRHFVAVVVWERTLPIFCCLAGSCACIDISMARLLPDVSCLSAAFLSTMICRSFNSVERCCPRMFLFIPAMNPPASCCISFFWAAVGGGFVACLEPLTTGMWTGPGAAPPGFPLPIFTTTPPPLPFDPATLRETPQSAENGKLAAPPRVSAQQHLGHGVAASPRSARHLPGKISRTQSWPPSGGSFPTSANALPLPTHGTDTAETRRALLEQFSSRGQRLARWRTREPVASALARKFYARSSVPLRFHQFSPPPNLSDEF